MVNVEDIERDAWWVVFYIALIPASYCLLRSFLYKLIKFIFGEQFIYANPRFLPLTRLNAALKIFPPMHFNPEQRQKWESNSWIYFLVFVLLIITVHLVPPGFF